MGIPHGLAPPDAGLQRVNSYEPQNRSPKGSENGFPSFEDTFKPKNNPKNKTIDDGDRTPIIEQKGPKMESAPAQNQFQEPKKPEAFAIDFNNPPNEEPQTHQEYSKDQIAPPEGINEHDEKPVGPSSALPPTDSNVVNVDEIQIKPNRPMTFEELLEKELNEKAAAESTPPPAEEKVVRKKQFLKRTKKSTLPKSNKSNK